MPPASHPASPSPVAASGRLRTTTAAAASALLFLLVGAAAAAAAPRDDKLSAALAQAQAPPQRPSPLSLPGYAPAPASRLGGASISGSDKRQAGRGDSSEQELAAQERATLLYVHEHAGPRGLASASSGNSSDPDSAGSVSCSDELLTCSNDRTCLSCVDGETVDVDECLETFHSSSESDNDGGKNFCQLLGCQFCCGSYEMYFESAVTCVDQDLALAYWTCSLESNGCSLDDLPCYGVNMTAILEAEREATTTSESEETTLTISSTDVDPDQSGSRRTSSTFFVRDGGVGGGVVGRVLLYACCVLGPVLAAGWY